jgi:pimeloyl-ACP methyl ester carboxylesterase
LCPQAQVDDAVGRLTPEPVAPFETALFTTARAASVPAFYVECLRDRILSRAMQRKMQARARVSGVFSLDCDHSPFFSAPEDLVAALHRVSEETAAARAGCSNGPR